MQATPSTHRPFDRPFAHRLVLPLLAAATWMGGCTVVPLDIPYAENHPPSGQKRAQAVHHWDVLADDVAQRIAQKIGDWPAGKHPIYIPPAADPSGFNEGFRKLLITRLVNRGITLSTQPVPTELAFDAQLVQHHTGGPFTQLSPHVAVFRDWNMHPEASALATTPYNSYGGATYGTATYTGANYVGQGYWGEPGRAEILVTTSLESNQRYLARTADIYYVDTPDVSLYRTGPLPAPTPLKTWRVVLP